MHFEADVNWRGSEFSFTALHQAGVIWNIIILDLILEVSEV